MSELIYQIAVGLFLSLPGIVVAVVFYYRGRRIKLPCYATTSTNLVTDLVSRLDRLQILYADEPVPTLTATKVLFWNAGADTISRTDVPEGDPIVVRVGPGLRVLDATVLKVTNLVNRFETDISNDGATVLLHFDYIDMNEGVLLQVLHTGQSGSEVSVGGTVKGAGKPRLRIPASREEYRGALIVGSVFTSFAIAFVALLLFVPGAVSDFRDNLLVMAMASLFIIGMAYFGVTEIARVSRNRIPAGFDEFEKPFGAADVAPRAEHQRAHTAHDVPPGSRRRKR